MWAGSALALVVAFFSAPLIVTFDSAHFLGYLPVLTGEAPLETWDVGRGPGFPIWLWVTRSALGNGPGAALMTNLLCLLVLLGALRSTLAAAVPDWKPLWVAGAVLVAFDPTSFGYFHVLLTECLAATFFAVGLALAAARMRLWLEGKTLGLAVELGAAALAVFAYHVKQPYAAAFLFPVCFSAAWALRHRLGARRALLPLAITSIAVLGSAVAWQRFLPAAGAAGDSTRATSSLLANNLASTCIRAETGLFYDTAATVLVCADPSWKKEPRAAGFELERRCSDGALSPGEVAAICGRAMMVGPHRVAVELAGGLRELFSMGKVRDHLGSGEEHAIIAHKAFRIRPEESPVFWLPEELRLRVESYAQTGARTGRLVSWLGALGRPSLWLHAALGIASFLLAAGGLFWTWRRGHKPALAPALVFVSASTSATYSLVLAVLGTTIDRYQYPVFPSSLVAVLLCIALWRATRRPSGREAGVTPAP